MKLSEGEGDSGGGGGRWETMRKRGTMAVEEEKVVVRVEGEEEG